MVLVRHPTGRSKVRLSISFSLKHAQDHSSSAARRLAFEPLFIHEQTIGAVENQTPRSPVNKPRVTHEVGQFRAVFNYVFMGL